MIATESGEGALGDPSSQKQYEAFGDVESFDEFVGPLAVPPSAASGFSPG